MHHKFTFGPKILHDSDKDQHCSLRAEQHGAPFFFFFLLEVSSCLRWAHLQGFGVAISLLLDGFWCIMARLKADNHSNGWLLLKLSLIEQSLHIFSICLSWYEKLVYFLSWTHWSWNKTITAFAFVQYENLFAWENFRMQINFYFTRKQML